MHMNNTGDRVSLQTPNVNTEKDGIYWGVLIRPQDFKGLLRDSLLHDGLKTANSIDPNTTKGYKDEWVWIDVLRGRAELRD